MRVTSCAALVFTVVRDLLPRPTDAGKKKDLTPALPGVLTLWPIWQKISKHGYVNTPRTQNRKNKKIVTTFFLQINCAQDVQNIITSGVTYPDFPMTGKAYPYTRGWRVQQLKWPLLGMIYRGVVFVPTFRRCKLLRVVRRQCCVLSPGIRKRSGGCSSPCERRDGSRKVPCYQPTRSERRKYDASF